MSDQTNVAQAPVTEKHLSLAQRLANLESECAVDVEAVVDALEADIRKAWECLTDEQKDTTKGDCTAKSTTEPSVDAESAEASPVAEGNANTTDSTGADISQS